MEDAEAPRVAQAKEDSLELELRVHQLPSAVMMVRDMDELDRHNLVRPVVVCQLAAGRVEPGVRP